MNHWKIVRIDFENQTQIESFDEELDEMWGGRAFTSRWMNQNVDAGCDPLGEKNDLVLAVGLLAGSGASSSYRLSIGAKSPLTKGIKESNTGGKAGYAMSLLGIRALVIHGKGSQWQIISVSKKGIQFFPADDVMGKNIFETTKYLHKKFGSKGAVISIGPAGEIGLAASSIGISDNDGIPARHAARGGLAAVMGSKRIKAIIIDPSGIASPEPEDKEALKLAKRRFTRALLDNPSTGSFLPKFGTTGLFKVINAIGGLPTNNFSVGQFDGVEKIDGDALVDLITANGGKTTHACMPGCVIRCSNVIHDGEGHEINRAFEFETQTLLGSNCGIDDLTMINRLNRRCDEIGLDTIEIGSAIAVAMEAGLAEFGDGEAALGFLDEVESGSEFGLILGSGAQATGEHYGVKRIPVVMGQAMSAYDPRVLKGTGVTYATSPMGADHTAGNALPNTKLPNGTVPETTKKDNQIELSSYLQRLAMIFDFLGLCWFARSPILEDFTLITDILKAQYGKRWTYEDLYENAKLALDAEIEFNAKAGFDNNYDLPDFFRNEPLFPTGNVFDIDRDELKRVHSLD